MKQPSHLLIVDIDNTLAENAHREHYLPNWIKFFRACDQDSVIREIVDALKPAWQHEDIEVIFVTGRTADSVVVEKTKNWLKEHLPEGCGDLPVFFRPQFDFSKAPKYKQKVVDAYKKDHHTTVTIVDDDIRIIEHFKSLGHNAVHIQKDNYQANAQDIAKALLGQRPNKPTLGQK